MNDKARGDFLMVVCKRCQNEQIVFGKSATRVKCVNCNKLLVQVRGGKSRVKSKVKAVLK